MIQISTQPGSGAIDAPRVAGSTPQMSAEFAIAMAQLLAPAKGGAAPGIPVDVVLGDRQDPAAPGKPLPVAGASDLIVLPEIAAGEVVPATPLPAPMPTPAKAKGDPAVDVAVEIVPTPVVTGARPRQRKAENPATKADVPIAESALPAPIVLAASGKKADDAPAPETPAKRKRAVNAEPIAMAPVVIEPLPPIVTGTTAPVSHATPDISAKATPETVVAQQPAAQLSQPVAPVPVANQGEAAPPLAEARPLIAPIATEFASRAVEPQSVVPAAARPEAPIEATASPTVQLEARAEPATVRPATAAPRPTADIQPGAPQPAGQAFAAAMFAARAADPNRKDGATDLSGGFPLSGLGSATNPTPIAVHAVAQAQGAPLDTRRDDWMTGMIERIEMVRDEGGARQAHIRLAPDALGGVDVAIRHDRGAVHVQITADTPAARAILADAAPRLAEMAESRGLKLGGGDAGQAQTQSNARDPRQPQAPATIRNATAANEDSTTDEDTRIA